MCGLCGALGGEDHWATGIADPEQTRYERRRARGYRIDLINRVLSTRRISVEDFQGASYVLANATGKHAIAQDLGGIWQQAESMMQDPLDPLDSNFLKSLAT